MTDSPSPSADPGSDAGPDPRELLRTLFKYRWMVLGATLAVGVAVTFWSVRQPKIYEAIAVLEYDPMPAKPLGGAVEEVVNPVNNYWMTREFYETQNRILRSRLLAERVVRKLGLHRDRQFLELEDGDEMPTGNGAVNRAAQRLRRMVSIEQIPETRLVRVLVRGPVPEQAKLIANTLADIYIRKTMDDRLGATVSALEWLSEQLDGLKSRLEESEVELHEYRKDNNLLAVSMENQQSIVAQDIQDLSRSLTETRTKRIELSARLKQLEADQASRADDAVPGAVLEDRPGVSLLRQKLREKLIEEERIGTRYGERHPEMLQLEAELGTLRAQLDAEIGAELADAKSDLAEIGRVESGLRAALDEAQQAGLELNRREIEHQRLAREAESSSKLYGMVLQRTAETNLARLQRVAQARIIDRALRPRRPVGPNTSLHVGAGVLGGLVLGIALAFLRSRLDQTVRSVEDVESLGLTVLGVLPSMPKDGDKARTTGPRRLAAAEDAEKRSRDLIVHLQPKSSVAECARTIRTNLSFMGTEHSLDTLVVTSASPQEGKTTVATSIAITMAQSGKRTALVDTDLRRPRLHRTFQIPSNVGVTSLLVGEASLAEVATPTQVPNLSVIPCGPVPPNPAELLHAKAFKEFMEDARKAFDVLVFDSPPLGAVTDAAILAAQVDGAIVVVKVRKTNRDAVSLTARQLRGVGANVVGAAVNDVDLSERGYGYGNYYYYHPEGYGDPSRQDVGGDDGTSKGEAAE